VAEKRFPYGGQAVIEGVMIRGEKFASVAVRRPDGTVSTVAWTLGAIYNGSLRKLPLARGVIVLIETLGLGVRALTHSANVSLGEEEGEELSGFSIAWMVAVSLFFGIAIFFVAPLFAASALERVIESHILVNISEGVLRLVIFVGYIKLIGMMPDVKRVFAYHGAEHMTIHAYEASDPLNIEEIRKYPTAHPRCGTAFLLVVAVVAIVFFTFFGRPSLFWLITSRIVLIPIIAGFAYEVIRFSGFHRTNPIVRFLLYPSLALQALTTRQPDDDQIEVAICALNAAREADLGHEPPSPAKGQDEVDLGGPAAEPAS
jgi:hypothetical protein